MNDGLVLRVKKVIPETREAITVVLEPLGQEQIYYQAGQFLTLIVNIHGKEFRRSYSLSSAPGIDKDLAITIKRVQNGEISRYFFGTVRKGTVLRSLPPAGRFTVKHDRIPRDVFLLGAGSGIVPLFSILKTVLVYEPHSKVHLIYSNHNENSIIFRQQIEELLETHKSRFNCIHLLSDPVAAMKDSVHAHMNSILLEEMLDEQLQYQKESAVFYFCGPFAYMRMIMFDLPLLGFSRDQIYREAFLTEINESQSEIPVYNTNSEVKIRSGDKVFSLDVPAGRTILKAALEKGIQLPYSCEAGICSTCSAHCIEGKIKMSVNEVLTEKDLSAGLILTCTGYPVTGTVEIRFD